MIRNTMYCQSRSTVKFMCQAQKLKLQSVTMQTLDGVGHNRDFDLKNTVWYHTCWAVFLYAELNNKMVKGLEAQVGALNLSNIYGTCKLSDTIYMHWHIKSHTQHISEIRFLFKLIIFQASEHFVIQSRMQNAESMVPDSGEVLGRSVGVAD